jgi:hypothetical protein
MNVKRLEEEDLYTVTSERNEEKYYTVDLQVKSCTCGDHKFRGRICKHICLVLNSITEKHVVTETCNSFQEQAPVIAVPAIPEKNFHYELVY